MARSIAIFVAVLAFKLLDIDTPKLVEALGKASMWQGMGDVYATEAKILFIEKFLSLMPENYERISLSLSGAGAVEFALKTALLKTKKSGFIALQGAYHGHDFGALKLHT